MTMNAGLRSEPEHVLTIDRLLDAPVEKLWRCRTEPGLFQQWFCPRPWYVTDVRMDLRPGGEFHSVFNGPDGESFENANVFLEVEPLRRLVTTDAFRPGWTPSGRAFMATETLFEDAGGGKTRYIARAMHWDRETLEEHERMGFHESRGQCVDQLEALVRSHPSAEAEPAPSPPAFAPRVRGFTIRCRAPRARAAPTPLSGGEPALTAHRVRPQSPHRIPGTSPPSIPEPDCRVAATVPVLIPTDAPGTAFASNPPCHLPPNATSVHPPAVCAKQVSYTCLSRNLYPTQ